MKLSILQWNVFYKEQPAKIADEIARLDPDIVLAQELIEGINEIPTNNSAEEIAELTGYDFVYAVGDTWNTHPAKTSQGNAIFTKHSLKHHTSIHLQKPKHNPPDPEHEGRVYLEAIVHIDTHELTVATTHLSYSHLFSMTDHRKKEIDALVEQLSTKSERYVFGGDLNSVPESYTLEQIEKNTDLIHAGPDFAEPTWTTKPFSYQGFEEKELWWRLDYMFLTQDLRVEDCQVIDTSVSDHLPVLLSINL